MTEPSSSITSAGDRTTDSRTAVEGQSNGSSRPKGLRPFVVLGTLLAAAFAGVWLSRRGDPVGLRMAWWLVIVSTGTLAGGIYWRLALFDASAFEGTSPGPALVRWRREEMTATIGATMGIVGAVATGALAPSAVLVDAVVVACAVIVAALWLAKLVTSSTGLHSDTVTSQGNRLLLSGAATILLILCLTWIDVGGRVGAWLVRVGHLGAFSLWIGGAAWHTAVVRPAIVSGSATRRPLAAQARGFRRHLLVVIPILFGTGAYQAIVSFGTDVDSYVGSPPGRIVVLKLFLLAALTALVVVTVRRAESGLTDASESPDVT